MSIKCLRNGTLGKLCDEVVGHLSELRGDGGYNGSGWSVTWEGDPKKQTIRANDEETYLVLHHQPNALMLAAQHKDNKERSQTEDVYYQFFENGQHKEPEVPSWLLTALNSLAALT
jgi:hypothetical protein